VAVTFLLTLFVLSTLFLGSVLPARAQQTGRPAPPQALTSDAWPQKAPELIGTDADWLNTNGKALSLRELARLHRPVLIDFWEYTCVNCLRTLPYLKEWNRRYAKLGLVIIGIHTPEFRFAHDRNNVATAVKDLGIDWPVLVDSDYKNWNAFGNNYWPRHYFIDIHGNIVEDHSGEGGYAESEMILQRLLKEAQPNLVLPPPMAPVRGEDAPGARCYPMTPEIYAGVRGEQQGQFGNVVELVPGRTVTYDAPVGSLAEGRIYLVGSWRTEEESLRHGRATNSLLDQVLLRYRAVEVNAVIKPEEGRPIRVYVTQDRHPVRLVDKGADIHYDAHGESYVLVEQPRMYRLVKNARYGGHQIALASPSPDFGLYSFTFTSCEER
jgi:thiol-disulfide isomerase/thioredoxin